jgi:PHD/YefM family antitoxin component YafN of YafNO toxin-antitoxin module
MLKQKERTYLVNEKGEKTAICLPLQEYQELLEDLEDLATIAERKNEPSTPLETVLKRLEKKWRNTKSGSRTRHKKNS